MNESEISALQVSSLQQQVEGLKTVNCELVKTVQHLKLAAKQREDEKLELLKELNQMRMKLCSMSGATEQAESFELNLRRAIEGAVGHMISATDLVSSSLKILNNYGEKRRDMETKSPHWSNLSSPRTCEKVKNKVRPMSIGGRNIQPVVSLNRISVNNNQPRASQSVRNREALPMHVLQDLFVPLMRIDASGFLPNNEETMDDSGEELGINENAMDDSITNEEDIDGSRVLEDIQEEESNSNDLSALNRRSMADPLEGPSWLLDAPSVSPVAHLSSANVPDSTSNNSNNSIVDAYDTKLTSHVFTPTVRRRRRISSPPIVTSPNLLTTYSGRAMRKKHNISLPKSSLLEDDDDDDGALAGCSGEQRLTSNDHHSGETFMNRSEASSLSNGAIIEMDDNQTPGCSREVRTSTPNGFISCRKMRRSRDSITEVDENLDAGGSGERKSSTKIIKEPEISKSSIAKEIKKAELQSKTSKRSSHMEPLNGRVLQVSLTKISLDNDCGDITETQSNSEHSTRSRNSSRNKSDRSAMNRSNEESTESRSSPGEASGKRMRRSRKQVTYTEKPLNRKLRR